MARYIKYGFHRLLHYVRCYFSECKKCFIVHSSLALICLILGIVRASLSENVTEINVYIQIGNGEYSVLARFFSFVFLSILLHALSYVTIYHKNITFIRYTVLCLTCFKVGGSSIAAITAGVTSGVVTLLLYYIPVYFPLIISLIYCNSIIRLESGTRGLSVGACRRTRCRLFYVHLIAWGCVAVFSTVFVVIIPLFAQFIVVL